MTDLLSGLISAPDGDRGRLCVSDEPLEAQKKHSSATMRRRTVRYNLEGDGAECTVRMDGERWGGWGGGVGHTF